MGKEMTKMKNIEPLEDYRLQSEFQRKLRKQPLRIRSALKSMGSCCRKMIPRNNLGGVPVLGTRHLDRVDSKHLFERTGFHGTSKCNNQWACPVCAARLLTARAKALTAYLESVSETHCAFMMTFTIPHVITQSAEEVIENFKKVRNYATRGVIDRMMRTMKTEGTVTTNEVTYTPYGWHYHQHILYVVPKESWQMVESFFTHFERRWNTALKIFFVDYIPEEQKSQSVMISRNSRGEILQVTDGRYLYGYGVEMTKSRKGKPNRRGVYGSRSLFELIDSADERDFDRVCEWLLASRKLHRITLSRGLGPKIAHFTEEKKISESANIETVVVGSFTESGWRDLLEAETVSGLPLRYGVLKAALDGYEAVVQFLARHNLLIPFLPPTRIICPITSTITEKFKLEDSVRKRYNEWAAKDACIHEDILALTATIEANKRRWEENKASYISWAKKYYASYANE